MFGEAIEVPLLGKSLVEICSGSHVLPQGWQKLESVDRGREFPREIQLLIEACRRYPLVNTERLTRPYSVENRD